jgi:hypothetical protein
MQMMTPKHERRTYSGVIPIPVFANALCSSAPKASLPSADMSLKERGTVHFRSRQ